MISEYPTSIAVRRVAERIIEDMSAQLRKSGRTWRKLRKAPSFGAAAVRGTVSDGFVAWVQTGFAKCFRAVESEAEADGTHRRATRLEIVSHYLKRTRFLK